MSMKAENKKKLSNIESELYLLIAKFLNTGPCKESAKVLREEIEKHELLPKRVDWLGNEHSRTFNELDTLLSQIADDHLLKVCSRIGPILDKEIPPTVPGLTSLLGVGRQSFLRTKEDLEKPRWQSSNLLARKSGMPLLPSQAAQSAYPPNIVQVLMSREMSGSLSCRHTFTPKIYARQQNYRRLLGHLSSVYCVLFDRTGKYIFTGADDLLVKIWSAMDGRLLASLRGHSAEITDMAVNYENTLLAAGSCDKTIRVWCLRTTAPVAVLNAHTGMVTSLQFCPYPKKEDHLLISTGNDGCVCFWQWNPRNNAFNPKPLKFTERNKPGAQMICSSFSKGGLFLATGSTDHNVRVYNIAGSNGPEKILEKEAHTDRVDSLQFSNSDCRFITGSKDGTASIWQYKKQAWSSIQLKMTTKLPEQSDEPEDTKIKLRVTMVGWTLDDSRVITAVSDYSIKIWDSNNGSLRYVLKGHEDEVFVLEPHPLDPRVFLSSGHDGRIILWDLVTGTIIKNHFNLIEGQGHGAVFDCKFSPDGMTIASTDSHGHLSIFGFGAADRYKKVPEEQFFHTDYRPLIRDIHHHVLDEQTQTAPHLLPPPFLVDIDGNPYPPQFQRLVPGREQCNDSQLIPYVAVSADGDAEILEPVRPANDAPNRPTIDDMIERLQLEQNQNSDSRENSESNSQREPPDSPTPSRRMPNDDAHNGADQFSPRTPRSQAAHSRVGLRRTGDVEGVQSLGNWQSRGNQTDLPSWVKRVVVKPMKHSLAEAHMKARLSHAEHETNLFNRERKWRPPPEPAKELQSRSADNLHWLKRPGLRAGTRARTQEDALNSAFGDEFENPDNVPSSAASETEQEEEEKEEENFTDSSDDSGSGEYSDWEEDAGKKKKSEPGTSRPSRARRRPRILSDEDQEGEMDDDSETREGNTDDEGTSGTSKPPKKSKSKMSRKGKKPSMNGKKLPERFRPPEWLTDVMPHKAPYLPQIGDEIIYFRQGHELYVQAVKRNRAYDIYMRDQPWRKFNIRDQEVAIIEDITFENHPPRLCCLKLALSNPACKQAESFTVKYHDMEDVIEFIILKQNYDQAMYYDWKPGDRFRSAIDKAWWLGTVKAQKPLNPRFPDSMFQCFLVKWDNGEREQMSPWDFERIDSERLPSVEGGSVDITPEERLAMMYIPESHEWSVFGRDHDCDRIYRGLTRIMELSIAEPFTTPVDLNVYPSYAIVVEYPMDLGTIGARVQNRFYRRLAALKFDVQYIGINALKFNEPTSRIVKQAKCVVDLCLRFIGSPNCNDPMVFYHEMMEAKQSRSQDSQSELDVLCSESDSDGEHNAKIKRKKQNALQTSKRMRLGNQKYTSSSWREQCIALTDSMFQWEDSTPFRYPVSLTDYPDYRDIIDCPMDLSTVRDRLNDNYYDSPTDLCKDVRLIFQNSRTYNINKKSRIYSMTIRLSAMFEEHIRGIVSDWKSAVKYEEKIRNNQYVSNRRKPLNLVQDGSVNVGASTSRGFLPTLPSTSRGDAHRVSMNRILNAAYSEPSTSRNKLTNGIGQKKKSKSEISSKSLVMNIKKKNIKPTMDTSITNGIAKKKHVIPPKQKIPEKSLKKRTEIVHKKEQPSSFEGSQSESEASHQSDNSSGSESDGSEWGSKNNSKKRPKINSESEDSLHHSKSKRQRRNPVPQVKRTFRTRVIKKHLRHTRSSSSLYRKPSAFTSQVRSLNRPSKSSSFHEQSKVMPVSSPPSKRAHLRRVTVQPQRYANSGTSSESEASESPSSKGDSTSNSLGSSKKSTKENRTLNKTAATESINYSSTSESEEPAKPRRRLPKNIGRSALLVSSPRQTRNRGQRTVRYGEYSDEENYEKDKLEKEEDDYDSGNSQPLLSLSSRGRLRKAPPKEEKIIKSVIKKKLPQKMLRKDGSFSNGNSLHLSNEDKNCYKNLTSRKLSPNVYSSTPLRQGIKKGLRKFKSTPVLPKHRISLHSTRISLRTRSPLSKVVRESNIPHSAPSTSKLLQTKNEEIIVNRPLKACDKKKLMSHGSIKDSLLNKKGLNNVSDTDSVLKQAKYNLVKQKVGQRLTRSLACQKLSNSNRLHSKSRDGLANDEKPTSNEESSEKNSISNESSTSSSDVNKSAYRSSKNDENLNDNVSSARKMYPCTKRKLALVKNKSFATDNKPNSTTISSHTRSAVNKEDTLVHPNESQVELNSTYSEYRKTKDDELAFPSTSNGVEDPGSSNQSKENSNSAANKRKWYQRKIRTAARISSRISQNSGTSTINSNKRETRYSGRRTVIYTEDIDSPYLMEMLENEDNFESEPRKNNQKKEILTSFTNVPLSRTVLTNAKKRRSYVRCRLKHSPKNLKRYSLRMNEEIKKPLKQLSNGIETRNRGERTMLYNDDSDFSDEFENLEPVELKRRSCF